MRSSRGARRTTSRQVKPAGLALLVMGLSVAAVEVIIHLLQGGTDRFFWIEIAAYVLVLPLVSFLFLRWLERSDRERALAEESLEEFIILVYELSSTSDLTELVRKVVEFPVMLLPVSSSALFLYDNEIEGYELTGVWMDSQGEPRARASAVSSSAVDLEKLQKMSAFYQLPSTNGSEPVGQNRFCLPLALAGHPVGYIQMELPDSRLPSDNQVHLLNRLAPELALAIDRARLNIAVRSLADIVEAERRHIAQDLHDTLGQNIAFLRLKLDQITYGDNPLQNIHQIMQELERMRTIADEAYQQVRETLADLHPENYKDFTRALLDQSRAISARAGFQLNFNQEGMPLPLHPHVKRQILYICREALSNIEKHAHASEAKVVLDWHPSRVRVMILDDGRGFAPAEVDGQNHYGLTIMKERAESISAFLEVKSKAGEGTRVLLELPLAAQGTLKGRSAVQDITVPIFTPRAKSAHENPHR